MRSLCRRQRPVSHLALAFAGAVTTVGAMAPLAGFAGCRGNISDPSGRTAPDGQPPSNEPDAGAVNPPGRPVAPAPARFSCDGTALPGDLPLPRLSRRQLENTLRFAVALAVPSDANAIWREVSDTFAAFPIDQRAPAPGDLKGGYGRFDQSIQQAQVDAMYDVALAIAHALTATADRVKRFLGPCADDASTANDRACLETFVRGWGSRVMRYALPDAEVTWFADIAGPTPVDPAALADVIVTILASPRVVYRIEHGTLDAQAMSPLSAYELAARLSYQFLQTPPDDLLWNAATNGSLLTPDGFAAALARVLSSPQLGDSMDEFVNEWLRLEELPSLEALRDDVVFQSFAGSPLPSDVTRAAMLDDVRQSLRATLAAGRSVADFFNDRSSYASDPSLASIYGVAPWNGVGAPPAFPSSARAGLLGRAALLATGTASTRPIHKGYLIRNALLCEQVGAPPPNAAAMPPTPTAALTTREAVTQLTSGGTCAGCHAQLINPQGFVLERFDALGRERTDERLFDTRGELTDARPLDTNATVLVGGELWTVSTPAELGRIIDGSKLFASCIARHYFRFSHSRVESASADGCLLSAMEAVARSDAPLIEMLKVTANDATFKTRRFR